MPPLSLPYLKTRTRINEIYNETYLESSNIFIRFVSASLPRPSIALSSPLFTFMLITCSRISRTMGARTCAPNLGLMGYPSSEKKVVFSLSLSFSFFTRPTFSPPLVSPNLRDPLHCTRSYYYFFFNIEGGGNSLRLLERGFHD